MGKRKRKYDKEFKIEAVRLATKSDRSTAEVARDLGIHPNLIYNWKESLAEDKDQAFPGQGRLKQEAEEMRRLKRQLADIQEERDILKKALAIFSRTPK
jgi:transposase